MTSGLTVVPVPANGCEDVVVGCSGRDEGVVFTGTEDGSIWRISHDRRRVDLLASTGGRPLGLELDPDGRLLVGDARRGLLRIDTRDGAVEAIARDVEGRPMLFCNNVAVSSSGTLWFSDSSTRFGIGSWKDEIVQNTRTGRLLRLDPGGVPTIALGGLGFAGGVVLGREESYVAVSETSTRTVIRFWLTGSRAGSRDYLATNLPGYPSSLSRGSDGLIWVTLTSRYDQRMYWLQRSPQWLQRGITRMPRRLQRTPASGVHVRAYDDDGRLVHDCEIATTAYSMVTGVREHEGTVWLGSLTRPGIALFQL